MQYLILREHVIDAVDTLNTLESDFMVGVMVLRDYSNRFRSEGELSKKEIKYRQMVHVRRMALSYLVLNLRKIPEFQKKYHILLNKEHKSLLNPFLKRINSPELKTLRDMWVAHASCKEKPLSNRDITKLFEAVGEEGEADFIRWIYDPKENSDMTTIVGVVRQIKQSILEDHEITDEEMVKRYSTSLNA